MRKLLTYLLTSIVILPFYLKAQETFPINGIPDQRHITYAFTHVRIHTDYHTVVDSAILLVKDGLVLDAGQHVSIPPDAVSYDLAGYSIYPSFIDLFSDYGLPEIKKASSENRGPQFLSNTKGAYGWNQAIKPEQQASGIFSYDDKKANDFRQSGFGVVMSHVRDGIARGTGVIVSLTKGKDTELIMRKKAAAFYSFDKGSSSQDYPGSLMGSISLLRQTYLDGQWYKSQNSKREVNLSLEAWNTNQDVPQVFEVTDKNSILRACRIGEEFGVRYIIKGKGDEYQRISEIKAVCDALLIPVNFPEAFDVADPYEAQNVSLAEMKHWEMAPGNAAALEKAGIRFAFTTADLKNKKDFIPNIRKAIANGLSEESALKACTYTPALLAGIEKNAGSLKKGMQADFLITSGNIFDPSSIIYENWTQGMRNIIKARPKQDIRGNYNLLLGNKPTGTLKITGTASEPSLQLEADSIKTKVTFSESQDLLLLSFESKKTGKGLVRLNGAFDYSRKNMNGTGYLPDGSPVSWQARYSSSFVPETKKDTLKKDSLILGPLLYPNMAYGFRELPEAKTVIIRNVTVWTNEDAGILTGTDVVIHKGKITRIAKSMDSKAYPGAEVIDGTGKHLTSGIIDEHSHIAISGDVNECTQSVTSEVRIGDVVESDDINIYRQLSGGVTCSHLLHGSCNPIGGQTQLIKLRWGQSPEKMKVQGWDGFIKFALGENVKQSNWGDLNVTRYPQTRMGVEQTYINAFSRAREYDDSWKKYNALAANLKANALVPRRDLELDALVEILNKKRFITCHSYQQGEINMLMHVADSFGFKVNTFTHILEGYKVADKMKQHGAGASSFSDWWTYKFEVIEAIPQNGAILHDMGIVTAFNSDDAEMARRLNQEAAKAVKYGHVSEEEAMKFVTLNPARLLHIDQQTGSIKEGKDADMVLWSDNPLSIYARVEKTFVDGICYYDVNRDRQLQQEIASEKTRLIQKMIVEKNKGGSTQKPGMTVHELHQCIDRENEAAEKSVY